MKNGIQRFWRRLDYNVRGTLLVIRYPSTMKMARINLCAWFFALMFAVSGIVLSISTGMGWSLWLNAAIGVLDIYMLHRSWLGYRFARRPPARRRA